MDDNELKNNRINLRINNLKVLDDITNLSKTCGISKTIIINQSIMLGLPILKKTLVDEDTSSLDSNISDSIKLIIREELKKIKEELIHLSIGQHIDELILSSIYQHLILTINSSASLATIPENLTEQFDKQMPPKFDNLKATLIKNFFKKEE